MAKIVKFSNRVEDINSTVEIYAAIDDFDVSGEYVSLSDYEALESKYFDDITSKIQEVVKLREVLNELIPLLEQGASIYDDPVSELIQRLK